MASGCRALPSLPALEKGSPAEYRGEAQVPPPGSSSLVFFSY